MVVKKRILGKSWRSQSEELHGSERGPFTRGRQERGCPVRKRPERKVQLHQGWTQAPLETSKNMPKFRKGSQKNVKKDKRLVWVILFIYFHIPCSTIFSIKFIKIPFQLSSTYTCHVSTVYLSALLYHIYDINYNMYIWLLYVYCFLI